MNKFKLVSLLAILLLATTAVNAQETAAKPAITLERTACFGTCPVYTISILEDGTVLYNGENFVEVTGEQTSEIPPEMVAMMVEAFADAGYFEWDEAYDTQTVSDLPTVITSVTRSDETHRIVRYLGDTAPIALPYLELWIDEMTNSSLWTGVQADITSVSNGTDMPLVTLQRGPCYGACPVYDVALFEDGTIVYTGIANVDEIGVHVLEVEPASITSIVQRAEASGYFEWQDSYEEFLITDQPTVTTSIQTADQYKRIVRYDGDPNAPIGLVRIEESIEMSVADLVG